MNIETVVEAKRGCGYRKPGGLYLRCEKGSMKSCGFFPIVLDICPCCNQGIKPARGFSWIDLQLLTKGKTCSEGDCSKCPVPKIEKAGLLWIGGKFYEHPADWLKEAQRMGVSRRIAMIPKDLKLGETWVMVAHRKAVPIGDDKYSPAIFYAFQPQKIEYVVKDDDTPEKLERIENRGISLVNVIPAAEQCELILD